MFNSLKNVIKSKEMPIAIISNKKDLCNAITEDQLKSSFKLDSSSNDVIHIV